MIETYYWPLVGSRSRPVVSVSVDVTKPIILDEPNITGIPSDLVAAEHGFGVRIS